MGPFLSRSIVQPPRLCMHIAPRGEPSQEHLAGIPASGERRRRHALWYWRVIFLLGPICWRLLCCLPDVFGLARLSPLVRDLHAAARQPPSLHYRSLPRAGFAWSGMRTREPHRSPRSTVHRPPPPTCVPHAALGLDGVWKPLVVQLRPLDSCPAMALGDARTR